MKRLNLLPDILFDKTPEQFFQFRQVILNAQGRKLPTDRILNIKGITPGILDVLPWRAPQFIQVRALPATGFLIPAMVLLRLGYT